MTFDAFLRTIPARSNDTAIGHLELLAPVLVTCNPECEYKPFMFYRWLEIADTNKVLNFYISRTITDQNISRVLGYINFATDITELYKIVKGDKIYYGNRYILFDENFELLYTYAVKGNCHTYPYLNDIYFCVTSLVFQNPKDYFEKFIITKMIPFYSTRYVYTSMTGHQQKLGVIIKDDIIQVKKPKEPTDTDNINEVINKLLKDKYDKYFFG